MRKFETGATRDKEDSKLDYEAFLSPAVLESYAKYMHANRVQADGSVRSGDNWQKGVPKEVYMKSMWRHFMDVWKNNRGVATEKDLEENLNALLFNVMGYLYEDLVERGLALRHVDDWAPVSSQPTAPIKQFEVGGKVRVVRAVDKSWDNYVDELDRFVGHTGVVEHVDEWNEVSAVLVTFKRAKGLPASAASREWYFPIDVLERVDG